MLLEAVDRPVRYHLIDGREVRLVPGHPVDLPDVQARKLLAKAPEKVRMVQPHAITFQLGDLIHWQTWDGKIHGPALVEHVTFSGGRRWAWVTWDGIERALSEVIVVAVEPGELGAEAQ